MNDETYRRRTAVSGMLLVDKPRGPTSMDCCRAVKHRLIKAGYDKAIRVGHGGTLDPLATGLVVVLVGKATKLCDQIMAGTKRYEAEVDFSHTSTTDDLEGELRPIAVATPPTREQVEAALVNFVGLIQQRPPAFSAMWIDGKRAYALARKGKAPEMKARPVQIDSISLRQYAWPRATIDIVCGKGTYIRSLARDLGAVLGAGGYLASLRRTRIGDLDVAAATPYDRLPERIGEAELTPVE